MSNRIIHNYSEEILDIVNKDDEVVKQMSRDEYFKLDSKELYARVINCLVVNSKGELWIPLRTKTKKMFPNCLDVSCGGYVQSGETYEAAAKEELREELNLENPNIVLQGKLDPFKDDVSEFMHVYKIEMDETPRYNPEDFQSGEWLLPNDLLKKLEAGVPAKSDLVKIVKKLF